MRAMAVWGQKEGAHSLGHTLRPAEADPVGTPAAITDDRIGGLVFSGALGENLLEYAGFRVAAWQRSR